MMGVPLVMEAALGEVRRRAAARRAHGRGPGRGGGGWPAQPARPAATDAPLAGTRAIDLAGFIAGPVVSRHLAMLGSDVVKVEPPSGDPFRAFGPMFAAWNQGKRSVALDLQQPADRERLYRLVEGVDVVVENFASAATRLGCDDAALRAVDPDLVTLSSSGYGDDASMAAVPAFDPLLQALGGIMAAQGGVASPGRRGRAGLHHGRRARRDHALTFGLVSGLYDRLRTGRGQRVRTSLGRPRWRRRPPSTPATPGPRRRSRRLRLPRPGRRPGLRKGRTAAGGSWRATCARRSRTGLIKPVAADNGLCVTEHHPQFGEITQFGQLVVRRPPSPWAAARRAPRRGAEAD